MADKEKRINFAWPVTTLCKFDYRALQKCVEDNKSLLDKRQIAIFGAGIRGTSFSLLLKRFGYEDIVFTDNNEEKVGGWINEYPILPYAAIEKNRDNLVVIISVENGYTIKEQLEKSGFVESKDYFYIESHIYERYLEEFKDPKHVRTLFMGDCGLTDISMSDTDFTNLAEMLKQELGEDCTKVLAVHGMGMRAFYHILSAHIQCVSKPEEVVIMANFETFTGKQHVLPRSQHSNLLYMISKAVNDQNEELLEYVDVTRARFSNFRVDYFSASKSMANNMRQNKNDKIVVRMNYMYELKEENENIVYMKKIIELCKKEKIVTVFFIPPANYMYAQELYGDLFFHKYNANVERLKRILVKEDVGVLDLSYLLASDHFASVHTIDETTNYEGRRIVTERLAAGIYHD